MIKEVEDGIRHEYPYFDIMNNQYNIILAISRQSNTMSYDKMENYNNLMYFTFRCII